MNTLALLTYHYGFVSIGFILIVAAIVCLLAKLLNAWTRVDLYALAFLLFLIALLTGCASSALDTDFRSKVSSADFKTTVTTDQQGNYGGTVGTRLNFRDPNQTRYTPPSEASK